MIYLHSLFEGKQVGLLYHVMDTEKFESLLYSDSLMKPTSFSRNKNYDHVYGRDKEYTYQIKIDGDKLSNNYKIYPTYQGHGWVSDEYEERVDKTISNVGKYILEIIVIKKKKYYWKEKGYSKSTYNTWKYNGLNELSDEINDYLKKYPHIKLKVKEGHGGKIVDVSAENKWLRSMGLLNPKQKEIDSICGLYKNKKLVTDLSQIKNYILSHKDDFYLLNNVDQIITFKEAEEESKNEYMSDIGIIMTNSDELEGFVTDENNNYVIIQQYLDSTTKKITVNILHNKNTKKDLPFYEKLVSKYTTNYKTIDLPAVFENRYADIDEAVTKNIEIEKIPYFYHATKYENLYKIFNTGIKSTYEGVYLTDAPDHAVKFLMIRGIKDIVVFKINAKKLNIKKLYESYDHNESFFKCKAYIYDGNIPTKAILYDETLKYEL